MPLKNSTKRVESFRLKHEIERVGVTDIKGFYQDDINGTDVEQGKFINYLIFTAFNLYLVKTKDTKNVMLSQKPVPIEVTAQYYDSNKEARFYDKMSLFPNKLQAIKQIGKEVNYLVSVVDLMS